MAQITLLTGDERRRRWSDEDRRRILLAAFSPGAVVSKVARQFEAAPATAAPPADLPVITIELANGTRLKINAQASPALISATLQALR